MASSRCGFRQALLLTIALVLAPSSHALARVTGAIRHHVARTTAAGVALRPPCAEERPAATPGGVGGVGVPRRRVLGWFGAAAAAAVGPAAATAAIDVRELQKVARVEVSLSCVLRCWEVPVETGTSNPPTTTTTNAITNNTPHSRAKQPSRSYSVSSRPSRTNH